MKTFQDYIDQYGVGGWKTSVGGQNATLVMMLRDEIANPGSTEFSVIDRGALVNMASVLQGDPNDEQRLSAASDFYKVYFDASKVPANTATTIPDIEAQMDSGFKTYASIIFKHGEANNPFTTHTDNILNDGTLVKDVSIKTDTTLLSNYYQGAINATVFGYDITQKSSVITSQTILTKMLELVIEYGIDTSAHVQQLFGSYAYGSTAAATAIAAETKLPAVQALTDPLADSMFKAYIAYFGRPADPAGLQFWVDKINQSGSTVTDMVNNFGNSIEYKNLYSQSSSQTIVNSLYQHLFNRDAEPAGLKFWSDFLDKGTFTLSNIAFTIVNSAQNSDSTIVSEKVAAARAFTAALDTQREVDLYSNDTSALNARKWLSTVTADHTANVKIVGIAQDVINGLQTGVDGVLAANGLHAGFY